MRLTNATLTLLGIHCAALACSDESVVEPSQERVRRLTEIETNTASARGPWAIAEGLVGIVLPPFEGARTELRATPTDREVGEPLFHLSENALDEEFWLSLFQVWSPDGVSLVFDAANGLDEQGFEQRLFWTDFRTPVPSRAKRIPDLPTGGELLPGNWDPTSTALPIEHEAEVYVARRNAKGALEVTLAARDVDPIDVQMCAGGESAVLRFLDAPPLIVHSDFELGAPRQLPQDFSLSVSPDGKAVALIIESAKDAGTAELVITECNVEGRLRSLVSATGLDYTDFSPDSRYLELSAGDRVEYLDLSDESLQPWRPETDANATYTWVDDSRVVLVESDSDEIRILDVEQRREHTLDVSGGYLFTGRYLWLQRTQGDAGRRFELVHPREPETVIVDFEFETGASVLGVDRNLTRAAFLLDGDDGPAVRFVGLDAARQVTDVGFPAGAEPHVRSFMLDGRGVFATLDEPGFELYWLPAEGKQGHGAELVYSAAIGSLLTLQTWPR
jgi:hypothetical protein